MAAGKGPNNYQGAHNYYGGKGQQKGDRIRFNGNCDNCGKHGHKAADCWSKGKGKGGKGSINEVGQWQWMPQEDQQAREPEQELGGIELGGAELGSVDREWEFPKRTAKITLGDYMKAPPGLGSNYRVRSQNRWAPFIHSVERDDDSNYVMEKPGGEKATSFACHGQG